MPNEQFNYDQFDKVFGLDNSLPELRKQLEGNVSIIAKDIKDPIHIASIVQQAIQALNASANAGDELSNRNIFKKFLGLFTGANNNLRDISIQHVREAQRATIKLIEILANNQAVLADSITIMQLAIKQIKYENIWLKETMIEMINIVQSRFLEIEETVLEHTYKIDLLTLSTAISDFREYLKEPGSIKYGEKSISRFLWLTNKYFNAVEKIMSKYKEEYKNSTYIWSSKIINNYKWLLRDHTGLVKDLNPQEDKCQEFSLDDIVSLFYSEKKQIIGDGLWTNLKFNYPVSLISNATLSSKLVFMLYYGLFQNLPKDELINSIKTQLQLDDNYKTSISDFGTEILSQMKYNSNQPYIEGSLENILRDIEIENRDPIHNNRNYLFKDKDRIFKADWKLGDVFSGRYYQIVQGDYCINFHLQYSCSEDKKPVFRLIFQFINPSNLMPMEKFKDYSTSASMIFIEYEQSELKIKELIYEVPVDYLNWDKQKISLIKKMEETFLYIEYI